MTTLQDLAQNYKAQNNLNYLKRHWNNIGKLAAILIYNS